MRVFECIINFYEGSGIEKFGHLSWVIKMSFLIMKTNYADLTVSEVGILGTNHAKNGIVTHVQEYT
jgi:hypothetical protein